MDVVGESYVQQSPSSPIRVSVCAARALNATVPCRVNSIAAARALLRAACGLRQEDRGPEILFKAIIAGVQTMKSPVCWSMQHIMAEGAFDEACHVSKPAPASLYPGSESPQLPSN